MGKGLLSLLILFFSFNVFVQENKLKIFDHKYYSLDVPEGFKDHVEENTRPISIGCLTTVRMSLYNEKRAKTYLENWIVIIDRVKLNQKYTV